MSTSAPVKTTPQDEEAPLLGAEPTQETCEQRWKRFKRKYRVHFGIGWVIAMLITASITYLVNRNKSFAPDVCVSDRNRTAAILLSVFFGSLGVDRFYLGYVIFGVIKILTGGVAGVWWVVDITLLAMNVLPDFNGCRLE